MLGQQPVPRLPELAAELWRLAWPAIIRNMLNCASDRATLAFVGHYDDEKDHYDGAGLGKMFSNVTGLSIGYGICLGLATLCSQAHGAGRHASANALYLRRCVVVLTFAFAFSAAAAFLCERILTALSQPARVARCSALYAQVQLVGVPFFWLAQALQTVCDGGLQDTRPGLYASLVSSAVQVALCAVCVHPAMLNWGYLGMAAARAAGGVVQLTLISGILIAQRRQGAVWKLPPPSERLERVLVCRGIAQFVIVALPGALMMWVEWWAFEALSILVGMLPDATTLLAAHGTLFNALVIAYMAFTGLNSALSATTGKYVGADAAGRAVPRLIAIALVIAVGFAGLISSGFYLFRVPLAHAFTADEDVVQAIDQNILGVVLSVPGYGVLMTLYGACQGANRQRIAFAGTLIGYLAGLPIGYYLGLVRHWPRPLLGVWLGNASALAFAATWILLVVVCIDWPRVRAVVGSAGSGEPSGDGRQEALLRHNRYVDGADYACNSSVHAVITGGHTAQAPLASVPAASPPSPPRR